MRERKRERRERRKERKEKEERAREEREKLAHKSNILEGQDFRAKIKTKSAPSPHAPKPSKLHELEFITQTLHTTCNLRHTTGSTTRDL